MHTLPAAAATMPSGWFYGLVSVLIGGAAVPFLLSLLPDTVALLIQRRRWRPLVVVVAAIAAALGGLSLTLSRATAFPVAYEAPWPELVEMLFGVGMVVALWHGIPRAMRSALRRRREDGSAPLASSASPAPAELEPLAV